MRVKCHFCARHCAVVAKTLPFGMSALGRDSQRRNNQLKWEKVVAVGLSSVSREHLWVEVELITLRKRVWVIVKAVLASGKPLRHKSIVLCGRLLEIMSAAFISQVTGFDNHVVILNFTE